jgi:hypothetical protein
MSVGQRFAWVTFLLVKRQVLVLALATATAFAAGLTIGRHSFPQVAPGGDSVVPGESLGEGPAGLHFTASTQASPGEPGSAQTDSRRHRSRPLSPPSGMRWDAPPIGTVIWN